MYEIKSIELPKSEGLTATNLTGSSTKHKRKDSDFYPTPSEPIQALINTGLIPKGNLWECACGEGHMAKVFVENRYNVAASDINETGYGVQKDFLETQLPWENCSIVTNPPFNMSHKFIEHAYKLQPEVFALLLKANYYHAKKRIELFKQCPPSYILALTWRVDFCFGERGNAPPMDCSWYIWVKGDTQTKYGLLEPLK